MKQFKAFKFRVYPTETQVDYFQNCFGATRFMWNRMLSDKITFYKENKSMLDNTPAQYKEEFPWLKEVDSLALSNVRDQLKQAFRNFFRDKKVGFPKFKSKKQDKKSYTTNNLNSSIRIKRSMIKLPKIGFVKIVLHRQIPTDYLIKSVTISQTSSNKYYISILTEFDCEIPTRKLNRESSIGLDYSSPHFYIDSNNESPSYPRFFRLYEQALAKEQRKLSHMTLHSNNYEKQKLKVACLCEKITNSRKNWIHKLVNNLSNQYDYVCIESLNMRVMAQSLKLGKSTNDNGWGMFLNYLQYKMESIGKRLIKIDKFYSSSKTCNHCGTKNAELRLGDRIWVCKSCGAVIERDYNAALNILQEGMNQI